MKAKIKSIKSLMLIAIISFAFTGCISYQGSVTERKRVTTYNYASNVPSWGPSYYQGSRYYYFPDIQTYYDLATSQFIVLNTGRWYYVSSIIPYYPTFDLYRSYIVVLNTSVYQPWMYHQNYVRSYPAYYYIDYYDYSNIPYVRGYNENQKGAIFWNQNERSKARPWDGRNVVNSRQFSYSAADRQVQQQTTRSLNAERASATTRSSAVANTRGETSTRTSTSNTRATTSTNERTNATTRTENTRTSASDNARTSATTSSGRATTTTTQSRTDNRQSNIQSSTATRSDTQNVERRSSTNYYGNSIGQPVRVDAQMRRNATESTTRSTRATGTSSTETQQRSTGTTTRDNNATQQRSNTTRGTGR